MTTPSIAACISGFAALLAVDGSAAGAQLCRGAASFASGPLAVAASVSAVEGGRHTAAEAHVGLPAGLYAGGGIAEFAYAGYEGKAGAYSVTGGLERGVNAARTVHLCILAGFAHIDWPDLVSATGGTLVAVDEQVASGGIGVGALHTAWRAVWLVQFASVTYDRATVTVTRSGSGDVESDGGCTLAFGAGAVIRGRLTVTPSFAIPLRVDGSGAFRLRVSLNLGRGSADPPPG